MAALALFLALVLIGAAAHKAISRDRLAHAVERLLGLPAPSAALVLVLAAVLEGLAALALLIPSTQPAGAAGAATIWTLYALALLRRRGAVLRFDTQSGKEDFYHFGPGSAAGELVFAPRVGATHEADGYAMSLVHRANSPTSELAIFAATDIAAGPIATVRIPFRVPSGFHCNYYAADNPFYLAAAAGAA